VGQFFHRYMVPCVRAFLTGSHGFVGPWLARHLRGEGDEVVELRHGVDITKPGVLEEALLEAKPDAVYHLAAQSSVKRSWKDPEGTFSVNALGSLRLCEAAALLQPMPRVLLVSSSEVYGHVPLGHMPVREDEPFAPATPYAASKAAAEMVGLQAWLGRGLPVVRARAFNHTGPGQPEGFVVPDLASQVARARRGEISQLTVGNLEVGRDLTDVRDVVVAYRLLVLQGEPGQAYNVCRGQATRVSEILHRLMEMAGVQVPVVVDPARVRPADVPVHVGDPARLHALTGWEPKVPLDETLAEVLASFG
jgi:GDP-4-dehydro-6-deoxy-D-mannose reductase